MGGNVGGYDRIARLVLGSALLVVGVAGVTTVGLGSGATAAGALPQAVLGGTLLLVGATLVVTGSLRRCPVNERLGIDTGYVDRT